MERSEQINELAAALAKAQSEFTNVPRKSTANIKMDNGATYSYSYAKLCDVIDMIRIPLAKNGLAITQSSTAADGKVIVETMLVHTSGQFIKNTLSLPTAGGKNPIQAIGSTISYGRRYEIANILGIATEEDTDAAHGTEGKKAAKPTDIKPSTPKAGTKPTGWKS